MSKTRESDHPSLQRRTTHPLEQDMSLLCDLRIMKLIENEGLVEGLAMPQDPYTRDSPIQAASLDLQIGEIFLPLAQSNESSEKDRSSKPKKEHVLKQGETAVILTKEMLRLPSRIAGLAFSPSRVSFKGLLITNPGHIDPGYQGCLRFTAINMGREPYQLRLGDPIATVLFFEMIEKSKKSWHERFGEDRTPAVTSDTLARLSSDFLDVSRRARESATTAASEVMAKEGNKHQKWMMGYALLPLLIVLITLLATLEWPLAARSEVQALRERLARVEGAISHRNDTTDVERRLEELDRAIKLLGQERKNANQSNQLRPDSSTQISGDSNP